MLCYITYVILCYITYVGNCEEELPKKPVGRLSVNCRPTVGRHTADSRPIVGRLSVDRRPTVDRQVFWGGLLHNYPYVMLWLCLLYNMCYVILYNMCRVML